MNKEECRACLRKIEEEDLRDLFQEWNTPWALPGTLVADDLARLADVKISDWDRYSKVICGECYHRLEDTCSFLIMVQRSDSALRSSDKRKRSWAEPVPAVMKNGNTDNDVAVEIKQEVLTDEENSSHHMEQDWEPQMDIKIEPEELIVPVFSINGVQDCSSIEVSAQQPSQCNEDYLDNTIKREPLSDVENAESEPVPDLPLDCMLCLKVFHSVTGLKAHVIAQHSYGTVMRKTDDCPSPVRKENEEFVCVTCRENFQTRTDLMVHETCHGKHVCFVCGAKFNTFRQLSRHGARCRPRKTTEERTRPPARPQRLSQSKKKSATKSELVKVDPDPKQMKNKPAPKEKNVATTVRHKHKSKLLSHKEETEILCYNKPVNEVKKEPTEDEKGTSDRLLTDEITPCTQVTLEEKKGNKHLNVENDLTPNNEIDRVSNPITLMCTKKIKTEDLETRQVKEEIKASSPTLEPDHHSMQNFLSFEEDLSQSSYKSNNHNKLEKMDDPLGNLEVNEMVTNCDTELNTMAKDISLELEQSEFTNSSSELDSNSNPPTSIPSDKMSQNMKVHLAINPLNQNSILSDDKMDIEQMESVISDNIPLVNVISEIGDDNVIQ